VELSLGMVHLLSRLLVNHSFHFLQTQLRFGPNRYLCRKRQARSKRLGQHVSPFAIASLLPLTCDQVMALRRNAIIRLVLDSPTRPFPRNLRGPRARRLLTQSSRYRVGHSTEEPFELFEYTSGRWMFVYPLFINFSLSLSLSLSL
jgi:hypothetical protein